MRPLKQETKPGMEIDKLYKVKEEPHLSGACIRSLVKQLSTAMNPNGSDCVVDGDLAPAPNSARHGKVLGAQQAQQPTQPQQHKKQARRRLHTSRPYQERLLNMAEARKEIVTALKFHRASMKQASEQQEAKQEQQQSPVPLHPLQRPSFEQDGRFKSRRNPRIYPSCTSNFSNYMDDFSYSSFSHPLTWPAASPDAPPLMPENPNYNLPNQTLGLNLNFHDFNNLDANLYLNNSSASLHSHSSPSSSSPPLSITTEQEVPSFAISQGEGTSATQVTGGIHTAMDDEGIAEIRLLGEQYQMEWNDTMNLVTSAWWFKFLKNMEHGPTEPNTENDTYPIFEELVEFPAWLNANESCLEQCSEDYFLDATLPCMDIGDIEGMDEEWLA